MNIQVLKGFSSYKVPNIKGEVISSSEISNISINNRNAFMICQP